MSQETMTQFEAPWLLLIAVSFSIVISLTAWGIVILKILPRLRINSSTSSLLCEGLLSGVIIFSIAGLTGVFLGIRIQHTFIALSVLLFAIWFLYLRDSSNNKSSQLKPTTSTADARIDGLTLALIVAGSLLWSTTNIRGLVVSDEIVQLAPWADMFFHARQIGNFAQFRGDYGTLNIGMYGEPLSLYHYGSYIVSALISSIGNIPSIQVATAFYPVFGMVLTGGSIVILAGVNSSSAVALLATTLLFFFPDPSFWLHGGDRWTSYFFFQQVGIGGTYAVAIIGLSVAYALRGSDIKSSMLYIASTIIFLIAGLFKVQIVLAYSIFFFVFLIWSAHWISKRYRAYYTCIFSIVFIILVWKIAQIPNAASFTINIAGVERNVYSIFDRVPTSLQEPLRLVASLPAATGKLFLKTYGLLFPTAIFLVWSLRRNLSVRKIIVLLVVGLLSQACIRLLIADNEGFGDRSEINRKTFVLSYFIVVFSFASLLWTYAVQQRHIHYPRTPLIVVLACCLVIFSVSSARNVQNWSGLGYFINQKIPIGLFESAVYLRKNSTSEEIVQLCENDEFNQLATVSERPVYIARVMINAPPISAPQLERFAVLDRILRQSDRASGLKLMREVGISWFLMSPECRADWEIESNPVFLSNGYRLYKLESI